MHPLFLYDIIKHIKNWRKIMDFSFQLKVRGDAFNGHYTNGLSMANSVSVWRCEKKHSDEEKTVFECDDYRVVAYHIPNGDVFDCYTVFENKTEKPITIDMLSSFCIENLDADVIHRATSFWSAEGKMLSQNLTELNMERSWSGHGTRVEKFGQVGSLPVRKHFPFVCLENKENGEFVAAQLYIGSSWQIEVLRNREPLTVAGGLADFDYGQWCKVVDAGESFTTPKAVVAKASSLNLACDKLVKAQQPNISPVDDDAPVIFNEYCTTWGNPTLSNVEKIAKKIQGTGIKYLVIDSGWYKKPEEDWWATIGDWNVSKGLFPNGIRELTDMIKSYGLVPGIWFEFEKVAWKADLYKQIEHLLTRFGVPVEVDGQRFLDMRQDWCVDYLTEKVIHFLRDNGFGYIKIDYNDSIGVGVDGAESLGEGLRQTILGTEEFFKKLKKELPDLVIEGCASGGHRLEPSFMELVSMASFSDAHECASIPIIAANVQRLIRADQSQLWAVLRANDNDDRINYSLTAGFLGRLCLSGEIFDLPNDKWQMVLNGISFYDKIKDIIKNGTTTTIDCTAADYYNPAGYQVVMRELGNQALLIVHTFEGGANPPVEEYLNGWSIVETFGSSLDKDFQGKAFILSK